ncbi:MAG: Holliday junction branch migration protein RuvA [Eubacterium sp.]|jgi:Holliday junction DNA helicase, RuvA subunit|nr:Holliday junction branch migration protein RuvA [Eubacterium sp.]
MIAFVKGILDIVEEDRIIIDHQGMGLELLVPGSILPALPQVGNEVKIYTYMHVREDAIQLFGFRTRDEKDMFRLLITVNGVGPKGALGILSVMDVDSLRFAILSDDAKSISRAPGIGSKTAGKVILELKDKCHLEDMLGNLADTGEEQPAGAVSGEEEREARNDAVQALVALGYTAAEAAQAVRAVKTTADMTVEEILKQSLKTMG